MWNAVQCFALSSVSNLFVLKYEDLQQRTVKSLRAMLHFVGEDSAAEDPARLDCAMDMSNQKSIHRAKKTTALEIFMNRTNLACDVW